MILTFAQVYIVISLNIETLIIRKNILTHKILITLIIILLLITTTIHLHP